MPNSRSARKSQRQNETRRLRNRAQRSTLRTQVKKVRAAVEAGEFDSADELYRTASKRLDQAAAKNLIHKNKAARLKSRLAQMIHKHKEEKAAGSN